jgi:hypothetical protein
MINRTLVLKLLTLITIVFCFCALVSVGQLATIFALASIAGFLVTAIYGAISIGME